MYGAAAGRPAVKAEVLSVSEYAKKEEAAGCTAF